MQKRYFARPQRIVRLSSMGACRIFSRVAMRVSEGRKAPSEVQGQNHGEGLGRSPHKLIFPQMLKIVHKYFI